MSHPLINLEAQNLILFIRVTVAPQDIALWETYEVKIESICPYPSKMQL
jgi:hypothetical protein